MTFYLSATIKSTIVLLLCLLLCCNVSQALKKLALNKNEENLINARDTFKEEKFLIKRCMEEPEIINLDSYKLHNIKHNFVQSTAIRSLSLHDNKLREIPVHMLDNLPYLNCLNLSQNNINIYDGKLSVKHQYLSILDLSYQTISDDIWDIETLDDNAIPYKSYKHIIFDTSNIYLPNLRYINLDGNDISTFKEEFRILFPKLTHLYLNNINSIAVHPYLFNNLLPKDLRCLSLKNNYIGNFTFDNLANITTLYLDSNPLENINIISNTLQHLSLSNCTKLNDVSLGIPNLEYLDISKNYNNNFLANIAIPDSVKTLILDYNEFTHIPRITGLHQLTNLSLNYNMIKTIRPNMFEYLSLEKLQLKGNKIYSFDADAFIGIPKLKYLDLSFNRIESLSYGWIFPLANLKYLNVNANKLASVSNLNIYGSYIEHLSIKNNRLKEITSDDINFLLPDNITVYIT